MAQTSHVELEITYTERLKGNTSTNALKYATVEADEIKVPMFINQGDKIKG